MRITILKPDNFVSIDGVQVTVPLADFGLAANFRALQWYDDHGDMELQDPATRAMSNERVDSLDAVQPIIDAANLAIQRGQ